MWHNSTTQKKSQFAQKRSSFQSTTTRSFLLESTEISSIQISTRERRRSGRKSLLSNRPIIKNKECLSSPNLSIPSNNPHHHLVIHPSNNNNNMRSKKSIKDNSRKDRNRNICNNSNSRGNINSKCNSNSTCNNSNKGILSQEVDMAIAKNTSEHLD